MKRISITEPPQLDSDLSLLNLPGTREHWRRIAKEALRAKLSYPEYLAELTHLEVLGRRERRIARRIREARFPVLKTLDAFEFEARPGLDKDAVLELFRCDFVSAAENIVLIGGVGTGKTHLAIAIGIACCQQDRRVRFTTAAELANLLLEAQSDKKLSRTLERWARYDVVCLDELGYVPFDKIAADLLFSFITKVYEQKSLVVTTNLAFARWSEVFQDATAAAAVIDRIIHHATILKLEGESYRLKAAKAKKKKKRRRK